MCRTEYRGAPPINVITNFNTVAALGTITIPQRPGRIRVVISMDAACSVIVFRDSVTVPNALITASNPGPPLVMDTNHWGSLISGQLAFQNKGAGAVTLLVTEIVESPAVYDHID